MTSSPAPVFDYGQVRETIVQKFRHAGGTRPDVMQVKIDGADYVIKDYNPASGWFGALAGPLLVKREIKALNQLQGLPGIPELYACNNPCVLITSYCPAKPASRLDRKLDWPGFESRLNELIASMHEKGVAHCDLRGPGNILIDDTDHPHLVDYVGCVIRGQSWNKPWNLLYEQACKADYSAVLKLKARIAPDHLGAEESSRIDRDSSRGWLFRKTSRSLRRFARWIFAAGKN